MDKAALMIAAGWFATGVLLALLLEPYTKKIKVFEVPEKVTDPNHENKLSVVPKAS